MSINSIKNFINTNGINLISELGNNSDSIAPMFVKDTLSNSATVYTFLKHGTKEDAAEKAIEGYLTGAVWLLGIPLIKKIIDKTIYPLLGLNPKLDTNVIIKNTASKKPSKNGIFDGIKGFFGNLFDIGLNKADTKQAQKNILKKSVNPALTDEKELFKTLNNENTKLKEFFTKHNLKFKVPTNEQLYKTLRNSKFVVSTAASALLLIGIIKLKQKYTENKIKTNIAKKNAASKTLINNDLKKSNLHNDFTNKLKNKRISFTGLDLFITNPILNTLILDGVIATTRLKEAREGERKEVFFREACQIGFIYGLAKPIQLGFEKLGDVTKRPIELDAKILFDKDVKSKVQKAANYISKINKEHVVKHLYEEIDANHPLVELLEKNNVLSVVSKGNSKAISYLNPINEKEVLKTFDAIKKLNDNIGNIKSIKAYKLFAIFGNIAIATFLMGIMLPKLTIALRKMLNKGDHRNPAIVNQEKEIQQQS